MKFCGYDVRLVVKVAGKDVDATDALSYAPDWTILVDAGRITHHLIGARAPSPAFSSPSRNSRRIDELERAIERLKSDAEARNATALALTQGFLERYVSALKVGT